MEHGVKKMTVQELKDDLLHEVRQAQESMAMAMRDAKLLGQMERKDNLPHSSLEMITKKAKIMEYVRRHVENAAGV